MNDQVILRSKINSQVILLPIGQRFKNIPRIAERLDIGDVLGPCATVTMVTHSFSGFYYPGAIMRRNGIKSKWGIDHYFSTVIDVLLDEDFYEPHDAKTWNRQMGWDFIEWLKLD